MERERMESEEIKEPDDSGEEAPPNRRKRLIRLVLIAAGVLLLAVGIPYYIHAIRHESTDDAFVDGHIVPISSRVSGHVARVLVNDNQWVKAGDLLVELDARDFQARLDAAQAALEAAKASSRSTDIGVDLTAISSGAAVDQASAAVASAKANLENARAQEAAAKSQVDQASAQLDYANAAMEQARADLASAKAQSERDSLDLKRYQELAKTKSISQQKLDHAVATGRISEAGYESAKARIETQKSLIRQAESVQKAASDNLRQAGALVDARQAQLAEAKARLASAKSAPQEVEQSRSRADASKARIDQAKAQVEQARLNLGYTRIAAPSDGFVTKKSVEPGAFYQVGQPMMSLVAPNVWVTANFKETQLTRMKPGQPVSIEIDTYPGVEFKGRVDSIQRGTGSRFSLLPPENATGNFVKVVQRVPVKILFDKTPETEKYVLAPGMSAVPEVNIAAGGNGQAMASERP